MNWFRMLYNDNNETLELTLVPDADARDEWWQLEPRPDLGGQSAAAYCGIISNVLCPDSNTFYYVPVFNLHYLADIRKKVYTLQIWECDQGRVESFEVESFRFLRSLRTSRNCRHLEHVRWHTPFFNPESVAHLTHMQTLHVTITRGVNTFFDPTAFAKLQELYLHFTVNAEWNNIVALSVIPTLQSLRVVVPQFCSWKIWGIALMFRGLNRRRAHLDTFELKLERGKQKGYYVRPTWWTPKQHDEFDAAAHRRVWTILLCFLRIQQPQDLALLVLHQCHFKTLCTFIPNEDGLMCYRSL